MTQPASTNSPRRPAASRQPRASRAVAARALAALRTPAEIAQLRAAGAVVREALDAARAACIIGATTADIDAAAMRVIAAHGALPLFLNYPASEADAPAFPACTCVSVNEEIVHGIPGARVIRDGDLVSVDCGVKRGGWCSDSAITVPVGAVGAEGLALLDAAERMLATAIAMAKPGVRWSVIAEAMQKIAVAANHGCVVEYVGHGIGRSLHESPQVPNWLSRDLLRTGDFTLRAGMVLAIEPMLTLKTVGGAVGGVAGVDDDGFPIGVETRRLADGWTVVAADGSPAVHVEHTVAITSRGCEVLSILPAADAALRGIDSEILSGAVRGRSFSLPSLCG